MPDLSLWYWSLAILAAFGIGISKSGFAGVSLLHVSIFAELFSARESTGALLPLLIVAICVLSLSFVVMRNGNTFLKWQVPRSSG